MCGPGRGRSGEAVRGGPDLGRGGTSGARVFCGLLNAGIKAGIFQKGHEGVRDGKATRKVLQPSQGEALGAGVGDISGECVRHGTGSTTGRGRSLFDVQRDRKRPRLVGAAGLT
ncbi:hypothetical protein GFGA_2d0086 (plasmid) [Gluconobacter frateurii NBRC 103465]|nr:hypothetical protein GFGA_2d0086 [Gluconobacter frateurii NBRC 103465]